MVGWERRQISLGICHCGQRPIGGPTMIFPKSYPGGWIFEGLGRTLLYKYFSMVLEKPRSHSRYFCHQVWIILMTIREKSVFSLRFGRYYGRISVELHEINYFFWKSTDSFQPDHLSSFEKWSAKQSDRFPVGRNNSQWWKTPECSRPDQLNWHLSLRTTKPIFIAKILGE